MPLHTADCPCALTCRRIKVNAALGKLDQYPQRALHCYFVARSAELFAGLPNVDWARIGQARYPRDWVRRSLRQVPHPSIIKRRVRRSRLGLDALEFDVQLELCDSVRAERTARLRRDYFVNWMAKLNTFLDDVEEEVHYRMYKYARFAV